MSGAIPILSSDTPHHRYFLNALADRGLPLGPVIFETVTLEPPFATGPVFDDAEREFETRRFFEETRRDLERFEVTYVSTVNARAARAHLRKRDAKFGIVFGTGRIQPDVIELFPDGLINVHRGIAEAYRGLDSDLWAIYHRDYGNIGVTVHRVARRLDSGDIARQQRLELKRGMRCHQLRYHTTVLATDLIAESLSAHLEGDLSARSQNGEGRYYSFMPIVLKRLVADRFDRYCEGLRT